MRVDAESMFLPYEPLFFRVCQNLAIIYDSDSRVRVAFEDTKKK
jgi:hypothetical protein